MRGPSGQAQALADRMALITAYANALADKLAG